MYKAQGLYDEIQLQWRWPLQPHPLTAPEGKFPSCAPIGVMAKRRSEASSEASSEEEAKEAFALLQPKCTEVMRAPSLSTLQSLDSTLHGITCLHPRLVDYVVLPLRMIIKRTGR